MTQTAVNTGTGSWPSILIYFCRHLLFWQAVPVIYHPVVVEMLSEAVLHLDFSNFKLCPLVFLSAASSSRLSGLMSSSPWRILYV